MAPGSALRLAMFGPVPPARSGIADYVCDLLPLLPDSWAIDLFVADGDADRELPGDRQLATRAANQWEARHRAKPYDLNVYQVGNSAAQAWLWPWVRDTPGLLVLHDAILHPARIAAHVAAADLKGYRRRAAQARPDVGAALGNLVASGLGGPALYRLFPFCEDLVRASRSTAVHGDLLAGWLRALVPNADVVSVAHWRSVPADDAGRRGAWRERLGATSARPLIGSFGHLGAAHRSDLVLQALADLAQQHDYRLVFVGAVDDEAALLNGAARLGIGDRVACTGAVSAADFGALMRSVDVALNLRYPTARSSSGTMQQLLQLGVPTVIHDLLHLRDVPAAVVGRVATGAAAAEREALRTLLGGWLGAADERQRVATAAAAWAARHVTPEAMRSSYLTAIERALGRPEAA